MRQPKADTQSYKKYVIQHISPPLFPLPDLPTGRRHGSPWPHVGNRCAVGNVGFLAMQPLCGSAGEAHSTAEDGAIYGYR